MREIIRLHLKLLSVRHPWCVSVASCTWEGFGKEAPWRNGGLVALVYVWVAVEDMGVEVMQQESELEKKSKVPTVRKHRSPRGHRKEAHRSWESRESLFQGGSGQLHGCACTMRAVASPLATTTRTSSGLCQSCVQEVAVRSPCFMWRAAPKKEGVACSFRTLSHSSAVEQRSRITPGVCLCVCGGGVEKMVRC